LFRQLLFLASGSFYVDIQNDMIVVHGSQFFIILEPPDLAHGEPRLKELFRTISLAGKLALL
jgi:hypothetical protein